MSASKRGSLVVIGSGPGIGLNVASTFAANGFSRIYLISRNEKRLESDKATVLARSGRQNVNIETLSADISDIDSLRAALQKIDNRSYPVEAVFFNAARVEASSLLQYPIEEVERDFRVRPNFSCVCESAADCLFQISVSALIEVARWAVPLLKFNASVIAKPSILVTNSFLYKTPRADEFSLSVTKAAQRTLVQCMNKDFCADGIHAGLISVGGVVYDEHPTRNVENIAQKTWKFFAKGDHNEFEVEIV
jgi:NAD(P)-dependent dehydrogenase (short-subunit alcohol dehydrogenase family)